MSWEDPVYGTCQVTEPAGDGTYRCTSLIVIRRCGAIARFTQLHVYDLRASPRTSKEPSASGGTRLRLISLADHSPHLLGEWDAECNAPLTPDTVSYGSAKKVHWICSARGHHFMATVKNRTNRGSGCPYCKGNAVMPGENDLATLRPDLALEWDEERNYPDLPSQFSLHSNRRFWWTCPCDPFHHWYASVNNRTNGSGCPFCDTRRPPMLRLV